MSIPDFFFNGAGRLRSGWRFAAFTVAFLITFILLLAGLQVALAVGGPEGSLRRLLETNWGFVLQHLMMFAAAAFVGWACSYVLEDLPWRALGWTPHRGWARDLALGSLVGVLSLALAAGIIALTGGYRLDSADAAPWPSVLRTLAASAFIFFLGAASEEALFRGYPLQTLLRSWPAWVAVLPTSLPFAFVHLDNPNVARGFTFVNTALAGVWLGVAYVRTRSLWFPLGVHWSWNWAMGALAGLPVSGITSLTPAPLLRLNSAGPDWLTGGAYGPEGGAACTLALLVSTVFIWRTRLLSADPELLELTGRENPNPHTPAITVG